MPKEMKYIGKERRRVDGIAKVTGQATYAAEFPMVNELSIKGMGERGMVGIPAVIANAVFHATGKRMRDLPITPDKLV